MEMERISKMDKYHANHGNIRKHEYEFASAPQSIEGYGKWIKGYFDEGFRMYLVTFKFDHLSGSSEYKRREMLKQVEDQFYLTLTEHVDRLPMKPSRQHNLPRLIAVPDLPVATHSKKLSAKDVKINGGLHVHTIIAMPPTLRHPDGCKLKTLIRENQNHFIGDFTSISHIYIRRITDHPKYVTGYVFKAAKRNPAILNEVLILPKSPGDAKGQMSAISAAKIRNDDHLRRKINEMRNLWDGTALSRSRSIFANYEKAVLSLHQDFHDRNLAEPQTRRMLKLAKVSGQDKLKDPIRRIIAATSNADEEIADRMAHRLRIREHKEWSENEDLRLSKRRKRGSSITLKPIVGLLYR
jgi:hypothetical protein